MHWTMKTAFCCHLCAVIFLGAFGLTYLLRPEFMPYHADAVGKGWAEVEPAFQILILALMRVVGGGFLAAACAMGYSLYSIQKRHALVILGHSDCRPVRLLSLIVCNRQGGALNPRFTAMVSGRGWNRSPDNRITFLRFIGEKQAFVHC